MCYILQRGRERVNKLVRELGQEANGVNIKYSHVTWQLSCMYSNIQGGKELIFRLETSISSQCFNQGCFAFRNKDC